MIEHTYFNRIEDKHHFNARHYCEYMQWYIVLTCYYIVHGKSSLRYRKKQTTIQISEILNPTKEVQEFVFNNFPSYLDEFKKLEPEIALMSKLLN